MFYEKKDEMDNSFLLWMNEREKKMYSSYCNAMSIILQSIKTAPPYNISTNNNTLEQGKLLQNTRTQTTQFSLFFFFY